MNWRSHLASPLFCGFLLITALSTNNSQERLGEAPKSDGTPKTVDYNITRGEAIPVPAKKTRLPLVVYGDSKGAVGSFAPSGYMGDVESLRIKGADFSAPLTSLGDGSSCLRVEVVPRGRQGWAGLYWQTPANNWGKIKGAGYDLTKAQRLTFWARGEKGGELIAQFSVGGLVGPYPDTDSAKLGPIRLNKEWTQYVIDLTAKDLRHIVGGFEFIVRRTDNPRGAVFYLDEIIFQGDVTVSEAPPQPLPPHHDLTTQQFPEPLPTMPKLTKSVLVVVPFDSAKTAFGKEGTDLLNEIAAVSHKYADAAILIEGHTDSTGPEAVNQKLSEMRAKAVADYLVTKNVPRERMTIKGHGSERPVREGANLTPEGRMKNRRVEVTLVAQ